MHSSEACSLHFADIINLKTLYILTYEHKTMPTSLEIRLCLTISKLCFFPYLEVYFTSEGKQDEKTSNIEQM